MSNTDFPVKSAGTLSDNVSSANCGAVLSPGVTPAAPRSIE